MTTAIHCENLSCHRPQWNDSGPTRVVDFGGSFQTGSFYGFHGEDGCGKGLLLNVLGLLEAPDAGRLEVAGQPVDKLAGAELCRLRNEGFGYLFNHPCLLPSFSVAENVAMPMFRICGGDARTARERTMEVLDFCEIPHLESTLTRKLDPAMRRRTALARALVHRPDVLIAVSPRGGPELVELGWRAAHELGMCVLWAGEKNDLLSRADQLIPLHAGRMTQPSIP